jgi:hypothetical protein
MASRVKRTKVSCSLQNVLRLPSVVTPATQSGRMTSLNGLAFPDAKTVVEALAADAGGLNTYVLSKAKP